jgi:hypothetical protein
MTQKIWISQNVSIALDTIAHHLSLMWPEMSMWWDFYKIDFTFFRKTDLDEEEILMNDKFGILSENVGYASGNDLPKVK